MANAFIALLGHRERPTDGVEDFCGFLSQALGRRGVSTRIEGVEWDQLGWRGALRDLGRRRADWCGSWVVVHYTAMAWSRRGFPYGVLRVLADLRRGGVRCAVLFHEATRQPTGPRLRDKLRGACQDWVIRRAFRATDKAIFTVPLERVAWLPRNHPKATYIPIGANIPEGVSHQGPRGLDQNSRKTVAVFCVSLNSNRELEVADLAHAAQRVRQAVGSVRFVVLGKGSEEARTEIESAFKGSDVELSVRGRLPADQISETLASADVLLYLCGHVSQTRGSALAGVACGMPIVGYTGEAREPIHEAGVKLVPYRDREALAAALVRVLSDDALRAEMRRKSREAQQQLFSWDSIAEKYIEVLNLECFATERAEHAPPRADRALHSTD
jgi:glycosyltransferase involved in cell wall biosynthesis